MTKNNAFSFRTKSSDFLWCFQCLYQNGLITSDEKNELVGSFKNCLSDELPSSKRELRILLENVFYSKDLPMDFKQQVENLLYITNSL